MPLVSVIMPVRNGGPFLAGAVQSILGQTLQDLELLLVDDHSSDGAVDRLPREDRRLVVMGHAGEGVSSAFNAGLAHARGAFIARMDADDISLPGRLEQQVAFLENHGDIDICGACVEIFSGQALAGGNKRYQAWLNACRTPESIRREMFIESPIPNPTALFRAGALHRLGGFRNPGWPEDYDLYLRADAGGMKMGKPPGRLLRWREHPGRLTHVADRYSRKNFQAAKAHYLAGSRLPADRAVVIWGAGPGGRLMHDLLREQGVNIQGFLDLHPRRTGGQKRGLPVWPLEHVSALEGFFILVAVGTAGVRPEIREFMDRHGRIEGGDYLFVA